MLSQTFLDEVQARTTMSALVGARVELKRNGREFKACCPVHSEQTPSFTVNDDKGFAHCFGCGFHAGPIRWLTEVEGLPFIDAVRQLAEAAGMAMPERSAAAEAKAARVAGIRPALEAAMAVFADQLGRVQSVQDYLAKRGVGPDLAQTFGLGLTPEGSSWLDRAGIGEDDALAAGLMWQADGRKGMRFRNRIMVPVHDARGRIVGFGGRLMPGAGPMAQPSQGRPAAAPYGAKPSGPDGPRPASDGENKSLPKYINSPDSEIFDKGLILFNLHRAAPAVRQAKRVLVVEGYFDVIALAGAGIAEAVAPMGTALTEAQLERLWQLVRAPVLMFDGDAAGRKAAVRACERALPGLAPDRTLRVALLPKGQDPDDFVRAHGKAGIETVVTEALGLDAFLFASVAQGLGVPASNSAAVGHENDPSPEDRAFVWEQLAALTAKIGHDDLRAEYLASWRSRYDRLISGVERAGREAALHTVSPTQVSTGYLAGGEYAWPESEDDSEKRLIAVVRRLVQLRAEERAAVEPIREERRFARELAKMAGLRLPQIDAVVKMIEADLADGCPAMRHDSESVLVLYRRVLAIEGPLDAALMPVVIDAARSGARGPQKALPAPARAASALAWHDAGGVA